MNDDLIAGAKEVFEELVAERRSAKFRVRKVTRNGKAALKTGVAFILRALSTKTASKAPVEECEETPYNQPDMDQSPDRAARQLEEKLDRIEAEYGEAAKDAFARRAPARDSAVTGMAGRDREAAPVVKAATQEPKTEAQAFAAALEAMTPEERHAALLKHYGVLDENTKQYVIPEENKWAANRGDNPTSEKFKAWLDAVFADRQAIGMVRSDLKYLDPAAHTKVKNWLLEGSGVSRKAVKPFS